MMKNVNKVLLTTALSLGLIASASAHDPKMHMKKAQKVDCSVLKKMDYEKMMKKDPVLMAMMKRCMKQNKEKMKHEHINGDAEHNEDAGDNGHH